MGLPGSEDSLTKQAVLTQYQRVMDRQTERQTDIQPIAITCVSLLTHVKNEKIVTLYAGTLQWHFTQSIKCVLIVREMCKGETN